MLLVIGLALGLVALPVVLRAFVVEAFKIPSGGMLPTLVVGDHMFVSKYSYGLFDKSPPQRGEVVVFTYPDPNPDSPPSDYVQRVIGLPNDTLQVASGAPTINGWQVPRCRLGEATMTTDEGGAVETEVFVEYLEGHAYLVLHDRERDGGNQGPYVVSSGEFWTMGDNRDNSFDSRAWHGGRGGGVPFQNLRGRAGLLWLPTERAGVSANGSPVLPKSLSQLEPELARCLKAAPSMAASTPPAPR